MASSLVHTVSGPTEMPLADAAEESLGSVSVATTLRGVVHRSAIVTTNVSGQGGRQHIPELHIDGDSSASKSHVVFLEPELAVIGSAPQW